MNRSTDTISAKERKYNTHTHIQLHTRAVQRNQIPFHQASEETLLAQDPAERVREAFVFRGLIVAHPFDLTQWSDDSIA